MEQKRLTKGQDKKLSGVCSGIANYFGVDPTLVRLITVVAALLTAVFPCLIAYFIASAIMPDA